MFENYDCDKCPPRLQEQRGCEKPAEHPLYRDIPNHGPLDRCPLKVVTEINRVMSVYKQCRNFVDGPKSNGVLPSAGGVMDQSYTMMRAFEILDASVRRGQAEKRPK